MRAFILNNLKAQLELATIGRSWDPVHTSALQIFGRELIKYLDSVDSFPITLLVGDGYGSFGYNKGGDVGYLESLARFGIPMFTIVFFGFCRICYKILIIRSKLYPYQAKAAKSFLYFSLSAILFILVMKIHLYTTGFIMFTDLLSDFPSICVSFIECLQVTRVL